MPSPIPPDIIKTFIKALKQYFDQIGGAELKNTSHPLVRAVLKENAMKSQDLGGSLPTSRAGLNPENFPPLSLSKLGSIAQWEKGGVPLSLDKYDDSTHQAKELFSLLNEGRRPEGGLENLSHNMSYDMLPLTLGNIARRLSGYATSGNPAEAIDTDLAKRLGGYSR